MKTRIQMGVMALSVILLTSFSSIVLSDDDDDDDDHGGWWGRSASSPVAVPNALYNEECGSCHMAYPAGLLPARSWNKMLSNLENHFDENAEVDQSVNAQLTTYLTRNSADNGGSRLGRKVERSGYRGSTPLRISETRYFIRKHDELPPRAVRNNPQVGSIAMCDKCHRGAANGNFNENQVNIPGIGRWDD